MWLVRPDRRVGSLFTTTIPARPLSNCIPSWAHQLDMQLTGRGQAWPSATSNSNHVIHSKIVKNDQNSSKITRTLTLQPPSRSLEIWFCPSAKLSAKQTPLNLAIPGRQCAWRALDGRSPHPQPCRSAPATGWHEETLVIRPSNKGLGSRGGGKIITLSFRMCSFCMDQN